MKDYRSASSHSDSDDGPDHTGIENGSVGSLGISSSPFQPHRARPVEVVLLFLSAAGCTMGWTALLSNLMLYTKNFGPNSFLILNLCTYTPLLPMAIAQARYDFAFDRQYRSWVSFSFRGHFGFFLTVMAVLLLPWSSSNLLCLSLLAIVLGTASGILQGSLKQMASIVYHSCGRLPAAVTSGMQASAGFVLLVSAFCRGDDILRLYRGTALLVTCCWIAFLLLMSNSRDVVHALARRDESMRLMLREPLLGRIANASYPDLEEDLHLDVQDGVCCTGDELSYRDLWRRTWPYCFSLMITVASSMSVASCLNRVHSSDPTNESLPEVLFYTRLFGDLLGRPATLLLEEPLSPLLIGIVSTLRLSFLPLFFMYASSSSTIPRSDALAFVGVAGFAFSSGFIVTLCYQAAPMRLADGEKDASSRQNGLINVCFSASAVVGLLGSFALLWRGLA